MSEPFVSNIISNKYDTALDFHVTMYDKLPYQRDSDYCNVEKLALVSGRVIKYYLYISQPGNFKIDNKDDEIEDILAKNAIIESKRLAAKNTVSRVVEEEVTQKQIQTLLDDTENVFFEEEDDNDIDAPEGTVNAFADVEDW